MGVDAAVPPGLFERIRSMIQAEVAKLLRSGLLRSASIGEGGLTLRGGFLQMLFGDVQILHFGPIDPPLPDGTPQMGWTIRRADGTVVLQMRDQFPAGDGTLQQALNWFDRGGAIVLADDTNSGQGLARPYIGGTFYRVRFADWIGVTTTAFETTHVAVLNKQHPKLYVQALASNDTSGAAGEVRVLVDGAVWGSAQATSFLVETHTWGPLPVGGVHMAPLKVELQARRTSGTGGVRVEPSALSGRQT